MMNKLGLYIHIPFCKSKCAYCDFYSLCDFSFAKQYVEALDKQLRAWKDHARGSLCDTVYIGGGTPTAIGEELLLSVIGSVKEHFSLSDHCEFTIEANPGTVDERALSNYRQAGVNRISFGVQSMDDRVLSRIGRIHSASEAREAILMAHSAGFENISADLMFSLPDQTIDDLLSSIEALSSLPLRHVSMYGLKVEENTPFGRDPQLVLPDEDEQCDMYLEGVKALKSHGFFQYEISNFSFSGYESRHNLKYWQRAPYLGFGCAAHSFFEGQRFFVPRSIDAFCSCEDFSRDSALYRYTSLSKADEEKEEVMLSLRTTRGIKTKTLLGYCAEKQEDAKSYLLALAGHEYAAFSGDCFYLTPRGMLVSNTIICQLLCFME